MRFTRWDQKATSEFSNEVLFRLSRWHLSQCSSESTQLTEIRCLVEAHDFIGLCHYRLVADGLTPGGYRHLRQVLAFFTKRQDLKIGVDPTEVAWVKAVEAEVLCRQTNEIFRKYFCGGFNFTPRVESVLFRAQRKISTILGDLPSLEDLKLHFGPGATTQVKKKDASARRKFSQKFACSEDAIRFLPELMAEMPLWSGASADQKRIFVDVQIDTGRVDFVPKTAKTDRCIAVEPALNTLVQLGIGGYMADQLRKEGVNIKDQTLNQRLAREGSLTGEIATLDLSSASDTIASGLVESLLPYEWWDFLRAFRTGVSSSPDGEFRLEKFSSMGNGFTFPLETLIFYSLAYACCDPKDHKHVNAYGDDIIVPTYAVPLLLEVLASCGFLVNKDKSYFSGNFRESCGKDYISGIDVRPSYVKGALSGASLFVLHNFYARTGSLEPAAIVLEYLDESLRLWGPDGYGDGHLVGDFSPVPHNRDRGWGGYTFETYTYKTRRAFYRLGADYVYPSYSIYIKEGPEMGPLDGQRGASRFLRRRSTRHSKREPINIHGGFRPERSDSIYTKYKGKWYLTDTLPGTDGYKRIKIYVLG